MRIHQLASLALLAAASAARADTAAYLDRSAPVEARVGDLLARLTLDEKLSLAVGVRAVADDDEVPQCGRPPVAACRGRMPVFITPGPCGV